VIALAHISACKRKQDYSLYSEYVGDRSNELEEVEFTTSIRTLLEVVK